MRRPPGQSQVAAKNESGDVENACVVTFLGRALGEEKEREDENNKLPYPYGGPTAAGEVSSPHFDHINEGFSNNNCKFSSFEASTVQNLSQLGLKTEAHDSSRRTLLAKILLEEGFDASINLLEAILELRTRTNGKLTLKDAQNFSTKYSSIRVVDLKNQKVSDEDLFELCCGVLCRLQVLKLHGNNLRAMPNLYTLGRHLRMLDLSRNGIENLPYSESVWAHFSALQVLFLHDNNIKQPRTILCLFACPALQHITLKGNPIAQENRYRQLILARIPQLLAIDEFVIADAEQHECSRCRKYWQKESQKSYFPFLVRPLEKPLSIMYSPKVSSRGALSYAGAYAKETDNMFTYLSPRRKLLAELNAHTRALLRVRRTSSPAIRIQKIIRGWCSRRKQNRDYALYSSCAIKLQALFRGWYLRTSLILDLDCFLEETAPALAIRNSPRNDRWAGMPKRKRIFKGIGSVQEQAATVIQRVWMKRNAHAYQAASANIIYKFFQSLESHMQLANEKLRYDGFDGRGVVFFSPHRNINRAAFWELLKFSCSYALRATGSFGDLEGTHDSTLAECFVSTCIIEERVQLVRQDKQIRAERSYHFLRGKERTEAKMRFESPRLSAMQAMDERWSRQIQHGYDANTEFYDFRTDIRRLEESLEASIDRMYSFAAGTPVSRLMGHMHEPALNILRQRVAGIRRPANLEAQLQQRRIEILQEQENFSNKAMTELSFDQRKIYTLFQLDGPLAQPQVLAWVLQVLRSLLRREDIAKRLKLWTEPVLLYENAHGDIRGGIVDILHPRKVLTEAAVRLIQSVWRSHAARMKSCVHQLQVSHRAAICIQRAWRTAPLRARLSFVEGLALYLRTMDFMSYRSAYYLLSSQKGDSELDLHQSELSLQRDVIDGIGESQVEPTTEANRSPCLYMEESLLRVIRRLKGRRLLRDATSLMSAQETSLASDCTFNYSNCIRLLTHRSSPLALGKEVLQCRPEKIDSWEGDSAAYWVNAPPTHRSYLRHGELHEADGFAEESTMGYAGLSRPALLRVGIPEWIQVKPALLESTQRSAATANADLGRILTRGAVLTSGELVVPVDSSVDNGKYFEKISMAQRLAESAGGEYRPTNDEAKGFASKGMENTGIVLVRLKFQSYAEARARAALCFARTWQSRSRQALFIVAEHMLRDAYLTSQQTTKTRMPWGNIPSSYGTVVKHVIRRHDQNEEEARRAKAVITSSEFAHRASTLQGRRQKRLQNNTDDENDDLSGHQEEDVLSSDSNDSRQSDTESDLSGARGDLEVARKKAEEEARFAQQFATQLANFDALNNTFRGNRVGSPTLTMQSPAISGDESWPAEFHRGATGAHLSKLAKIPILASTKHRLDELTVNTKKSPSSRDFKKDAADLATLLSTEHVTPLADHSEKSKLRMPEMVKIERAWISLHRDVTSEAKEKSLVQAAKAHQARALNASPTQAYISQREVFDDETLPILQDDPASEQVKVDGHVTLQKRNLQDTPATDSPSPDVKTRHREKGRHGKWIVERVSNAVSGPAKRSELAFQEAQQKAYEREIHRLGQVKQKTEHIRQSRATAAEVRAEAANFARATNILDKQERRRAHRSVLTQKYRVTRARAEQARLDERCREENIEFARDARVHDLREETKIYRLFNKIQFERMQDKKVADEKKLHMRVQHEKGLKAVIQAMRAMHS